MRCSHVETDSSSHMKNLLHNHITTRFKIVSKPAFKIMLPRRARHPGETWAEPSTPYVKAPHMAQAKALEHDVVRRGPYLECLRCGQFWLSTRIDILTDLGCCPGHTIYGTPERDRPWVIPSGGKAIRWGQQTLHRTHKTRWLRGVMYCTECGAYPTSGHTFRRLRDPCVPNPGGQYALETKRLNSGKLRPGITNWPCQNNHPGTNRMAN